MQDSLGFIGWGFEMSDSEISAATPAQWKFKTDLRDACLKTSSDKISIARYHYLEWVQKQVCNLGELVLYSV